MTEICTCCRGDGYLNVSLDIDGNPHGEICPHCEGEGTLRPECEDCGTTVDVTPAKDPWNAYPKLWAWRCENCHHAAYDRQQERDMECPPITLREQQEAARKFK